MGAGGGSDWTQDDITGDGTTSAVLFTGELLRQAERYLSDGLHPRVLTEGFELAKEHTLELLEAFRSSRRVFCYIVEVLIYQGSE